MTFLWRSIVQPVSTKTVISPLPPSSEWLRCRRFSFLLSSFLWCDLSFLAICCGGLMASESSSSPLKSTRHTHCVSVILTAMTSRRWGWNGSQSPSGAFVLVWALIAALNTSHMGGPGLPNRWSRRWDPSGEPATRLLDSDGSSYPCTRGDRCSRQPSPVAVICVLVLKHADRSYDYVPVLGGAFPCVRRVLNCYFHSLIT